MQHFHYRGREWRTGGSRRHATSPESARGRCGVAAWALGEIVKAQAGVLDTDSELDGAAKLARAVRALVGEADALLAATA